MKLKKLVFFSPQVDLPKELPTVEETLQILAAALRKGAEQMLTNYGIVLLRGNNVLYIILDATKH